MNKLGLVVGVLLLAGVILSVQALFLMIASAFLATELGVGAALSFGNSLVLAAIVVVGKLLFGGRPRVRATES